MDNAVELRGVIKAYGTRRALNGLDLTIPRGSIFGLVGSNGAGKTTCMSICSGLVFPTGGEVNLLGDGTFDVEKHSGRIAILPQDSGLPGYTRVEEILFYYARLQGLSRIAAREAVHESLAWVNLSDRARSPIRSLSHGMLRRLTVAQAFLGHPELIFLDEPMSGLDPREVLNTRKLIASRRGRQTLVVSSHLLTELEHVCDHIAFIEDGKLQRQDAIDAILDPENEIAVAYKLQGEPPGGLEEFGRIHWDGGRRLLSVASSAVSNATELNAQVLPKLLEASCGVEEVTVGVDLERAFLQSIDSENPPPPGAPS